MKFSEFFPVSRAETPGKCISLFLTSLLLVCALPCIGEDTSWVLAAEKFESTDIPSVYESFATLIPQQLLVKLSGTSARKITDTETLARQLYDISEKRILLVTERSKLILSRDMLVLSSDTEQVKKQKSKEIEKNIHKNQSAISDLDTLYAEIEGGQTVETEVDFRAVKLWKKNGELYTRNATQTLLQGLVKSGISGLVTGSIRDIAGYLYVTVTLETGIYGMDQITVSAASSYDELDYLVSTLASRILPGITNTSTVILTLTVEPPESRVFIDGKLVAGESERLTLTEGPHTITASAEGFRNGIKTADFIGAKKFAVAISLEKEYEFPFAFTTSINPSRLYINNRYFGEAPCTIMLPPIPAIGEAVNDGITTYFVFMPPNDPGHPETDLPLEIASNRIDTEKRIEKQRSILYWSIGALYISLPVSMLSYGQALNRYLAMEDGRLSSSGSAMREYNTWTRISNVSQAVSIGLGVNVAIQLFRYLVAADQTLPKQAKQAKQKK